MNAFGIEAELICLWRVYLIETYLSRANSQRVAVNDPWDACTAARF